MTIERSFPDPEQNLSDDDQTTSDADQTGSDLDQTASDLDQAASERDQQSSDRDQHAADLDQADSDRARQAGLSAANFDRTRRTRSQTTLDRDRTAQVRLVTARSRDATADRRDREAEARDAAANARDEIAAALDAELDALERTQGSNGGKRVGRDLLLRAASDRKRAAASRARAAKAREQAARDRALAREDRIRAAADRHQAALDLASEGIDHLTGALRRRVGLAAIGREIDRTRRTGDPLVVAFVDVDHLKSVNDSQGHKAGDELLRGVARCIHSALRPYDLIMRYGGDEFVCSLSGQGLGGVRDRFDQITAQIAQEHNGASITVGLVECRSDETLDDLIVRADHGMISQRKRSEERLSFGGRASPNEGWEPTR